MLAPPIYFLIYTKKDLAPMLTKMRCDLEPNIPTVNNMPATISDIPIK